MEVEELSVLGGSEWSNGTEERVYTVPIQAYPVMATIIVVLLVIMTCAGGVGNILVIMSVTLHKHLRTSCNVLVVNLALADLFVSVIVNPFAIVGVLYGKRYFDMNWMLCEAVGTICLISCTCSLLNILAVSINRYIAIVHSQYYPKIFTIKQTISIAFVIWIIATAVEIPNHFGWGANWFDEKQLICVYDRTADYSFTLFFALVAIIIPVILVFCFYISIFRHVTKARAAVANQSGGGKIQGRQISVGYNSTKDDQKKKQMKEQSKNIKLAKSLFIIFIAFIVCWGPYALCVLLDKEDTWPLLLHAILVVLAHVSSSGLNSAIYALTQPPFRRAYYSIITCGIKRGGVEMTDFTKGHSVTAH